MFNIFISLIYAILAIVLLVIMPTSYVSMIPAVASGWFFGEWMKANQ